MGKEIDIDFEVNDDFKKVFPGIFLTVTLSLFVLVGGVFAYQHLFSKDFITELGGIEKISTMGTEELTEKVNKNVSDCRWEIDHVLRCPEFLDYNGSSEYKIKYSFISEAKGIWRSCDGNIFYENPKEVILGEIILDGYNRPVRVICSGSEFLFQSL